MTTKSSDDAVIRKRITDLDAQIIVLMRERDALIHESRMRRRQTEGMLVTPERAPTLNRASIANKAPAIAVAHSVEKAPSIVDVDRFQRSQADAALVATQLPTVDLNDPRDAVPAIDTETVEAPVPAIHSDETDAPLPIVYFDDMEEEAPSPAGELPEAAPLLIGADSYQESSPKGGADGVEAVSFTKSVAAASLTSEAYSLEEPPADAHRLPEQAPTEALNDLAGANPSIDTDAIETPPPIANLSDMEGGGTPPDGESPKETLGGAQLQEAEGVQSHPMEEDSIEAMLARLEKRTGEAARPQLPDVESIEVMLARLEKGQTPGRRPH